MLIRLNVCLHSPSRDPLIPPLPTMPCPPVRRSRLTACPAVLDLADDDEETGGSLRMQRCGCRLPLGSKTKPHYHKELSQLVGRFFCLFLIPLQPTHTHYHHLHTHTQCSSTPTSFSVSLFVSVHWRTTCFFASPLESLLSLARRREFWSLKAIWMSRASTLDWYRGTLKANEKKKKKRTAMPASSVAKCVVAKMPWWLCC